MALFKPYKITSDKLADLPVREGQIVITTDTKKLYVDVSATERIEVTSDAEVDLSDYVTTTMLSSAIGEEASERQQQDNLLDDKIDTKLDTAQADNRYALKDNPQLTGNVGISNEDWRNGKITAAHSNGETEDYYKYVIGFDSLHRPYIAKKEGDNNVSMIYLDTNSIVFNKPLSFTGSSGIESNPEAASQTRQNIGAAAINHTHDDRYYTESEVNSKLADKANATHTHTIANVTNLQETIDGLEADIAGKAPTSHTHTTAQVSGLDTALAGKAPTNHNHNGVYSPVNHTHDQGIAHVEEKSTAGERYVKIMDYLCNTSYCRVNQQFILASGYDAILLTVQIATTNSKKIVYKDLTYLPLSQGYNGITSRLIAGVIAVSAEQDRFELWYKQSQWNTSINIIPLGKNYEGPRLNLFSYNDKVAGETKLPTFATQITLKRQTHSISEITDIANANTNSAKFIRDSQDNHTISLSYAESETTTAEFLPVFKDRNAIGNMKLTTLRRAMGAAPASHNHDAANITSGVLNVDRVPSIPATKLTGIINQANLPSYVDDVLEFANKTAFPTKGESGKIYVDQATNKTYRWSGSGYVEISASLALGTTSSTAFRGDYGNVAYTHATAKGAAFGSGLYKITTNAQGHVTTATAVTKSDITALGIPGSDTNTNTTYTLTKSGSTITLSGSDGSSTSVIDTNTTYSDMKGATSSAAGTHGLVPAPAAGAATRYLRSDGTWAVPPDTNTTYAAGTGLALSSTTFSLATSGVTAGSYGPTANVTGSNGTTINIPQITVDAYGRVTSVTNRVLTNQNTDTNTDTKVTTALAKPTSATSYYIPVATGATTGTLSINSGLRSYCLNGTASAEGYHYLWLGNSTAAGTANNLTGGMYMYGNTAYYNLYKPYNVSANQLRYLVGTTSSAAVGSATQPVYISSTGAVKACTAYSSASVSSAATLTTARTINGTSFNGSANITTANWGTARTITIGSTAKSVNGSANVAWTLAEIGAAASSHTHSNYLTTSGTAAAATKLATARIFSLTGDVTGSASFNGTANCSIAATLAANSVTANEIATGAVGLSELSSAVGTVAVQSATPTDSHVKLWIKV